MRPEDQLDIMSKQTYRELGKKQNKKAIDLIVRLIALQQFAAETIHGVVLRQLELQHISNNQGASKKSNEKKLKKTTCQICVLGYFQV